MHPQLPSSQPPIVESIDPAWQIWFQGVYCGQTHTWAYVETFLRPSMATNRPSDIPSTICPTTLREMDYVHLQRIIDGRWITHTSIPVAVNLAPVTLADPCFPAFAYRLLDTPMVRAGRLIIEITEHAIEHYLSDIIPVVRMLHEAGIRMVFDDIHRHPPLLTVLPTIPHDGAKVSYHAVATIGRDLRAIYRHHGHRMIVIEEIETFTQYEETIRWMGTPWLQGYLLHRPSPATDPLILPPHPTLVAME
jgi:EAL domain-containing protein (putative c-di-GMP-specific phosphodiesterase class I)